MPLCTCGLKVDRSQLSVQCFVCKQFLHGKCCNMNSNDIKFLKKNFFKCSNCIKERRLSCSSLPTNSPDNTVDNVDDSNNDNVLASNASITNSAPEVVSDIDRGTNVVVDNPTVSSDYSSASGVVAADSNIHSPIMSVVANVSAKFSNAKSTITAIDANVDNTNEAKNIVGDDDFFSCSNDILKTILGELRSLKLSNVALRNQVHSLARSNDFLNAQVSSLRNENKSLISKLTNIESSVSSIKVNLDTSSSIIISSPKRKRILPANDNNKNSSVPVLIRSSTNEGTNNASTFSPTTTQSYAAITRPLSDNSTNFSYTSVKNNDATPIWQTVSKKKKSPVVFGNDKSEELGVFIKRKWLHLSSFKSTVTADNVSSYVAKKFNISLNELSCFALKRRDADPESLKFLNFKLGVPEVLYDKIFNSALWPSNIKVRPFLFQKKEQGELKSPAVFSNQTQAEEPVIPKNLLENPSL